jgi:hypothetical protein
VAIRSKNSDPTHYKMSVPRLPGALTGDTVGIPSVPRESYSNAFEGQCTR